MADAQIEERMAYSRCESSRAALPAAQLRQAGLSRQTGTHCILEGTRCSPGATGPRCHA